MDSFTELQTAGRTHSKTGENGLLIINSSGGLIFSTIRSLPTNELLVIASTIHSLLEMTNHLFKTSRGINSFIMEFETSKIQSFRTIGGHTFVFIYREKCPLFQPIYQYFCEKVLQNYNYRLDMPISDEDFDVTHLLAG